MHEQIQKIKKEIVEELWQLNGKKTKKDRLDIEISTIDKGNRHTIDFVDRSYKEATVLLRDFKQLL